MKSKRSFWDSKLNPITMWKNLKPPSKQPLMNPEIKQGDQASMFRPKGFR